MLRKIHVKRNTDGKVIVKLYGREFDLTDAIIDGRAEMRAFGDDYDVWVDEPRALRKKRKAKEVESVEQQILDNSGEAVENDGNEDGKDDNEE